VTWLEDRRTRIALKWSLYFGILGMVLLVAFVLDGDRTHDLHTTFKERLAAAIGAAITLGLYSFLFGDNEVYRFLEHLIIGVVTAQGLILTYDEAIRPMWLKPVGEGLATLTTRVGVTPLAIDPSIFWGVALGLVGFASLFVFFGLRLPLVGWIVSTALFAAGLVVFEVVRANTHGVWNAKLLWLLAPIPGSLWYMMYSKRYFWLSRLIIVLMIGAFLGQGFQSAFSNLLSQIHGTFKPMWVPRTGGSTFWWLMDWWGNFIFVVIAFAVLFYFVFTFRIGDHPLSRQVHAVSRIFMMIAFGIVFATVVGTRMGLVTDRIYFLVEEWAKPVVKSWF
jgi:hypothetical protein